jgi:hypothetical protein
MNTTHYLILLLRLFLIQLQHQLYVSKADKLIDLFYFFFILGFNFKMAVHYPKIIEVSGIILFNNYDECKTGIY